MKKFAVFSVALVLSAGLYSCGSSDTPTGNGGNNTTGYDTMMFAQNFSSTYDRYDVDTVDANGNNRDRILTETKTTHIVTTATTNATYAGRTGVVIMTAGIDSMIFWQDKSNGDVYRYNFGVDYINNFPFLVAFIGNKVDIKWVKVLKGGAKANDSWVAAKDSVFVTAIGTYIHLTNTATMQKDTVIDVLGEQVACKHVKIVGIGQMYYSAMSATMTGSNIADVYISPKLGTTVWDFFRSSEVTTSPNVPQFNYKARGYSKIMVAHN